MQQRTPQRKQDRSPEGKRQRGERECYQQQALQTKGSQKWTFLRKKVAADNEVILPYSEKLIDVYIQRFEDVQASFEENVLSFHSIETILETKKVVERKNNYILRHIANSYVSKISLSNSTCFRQIQGAGLKLNQRSAICFALKATFLGHQVSNEVIQPNGEKNLGIANPKERNRGYTNIGLTLSPLCSKFCRNHEAFD